MKIFRMTPIKILNIEGCVNFLNGKSLRASLLDSLFEELIINRVFSKINNTLFSLSWRCGIGLGTFVKSPGQKMMGHESYGVRRHHRH